MSTSTSLKILRSSPLSSQDEEDFGEEDFDHEDLVRLYKNRRQKCGDYLKTWFPRCCFFFFVVATFAASISAVVLHNRLRDALAEVNSLQSEKNDLLASSTTGTLASTKFITTTQSYTTTTDVAGPPPSPASASASVSSVIVMLSDGMGPATLTMLRAARMNVSRSADIPELSMDKYLIGTAHTHSTSSWVTDSAAGATAYSCNTKTYNGGIAVYPSGDACATIFEAAKLKGLRTAFVVTSRVTHATPAAFAGAHSLHRDAEDFIAEQLVRNVKPDIIMGGGSRHFEGRSDNVDLISELMSSGYRILRNSSDLSSADKQLTSTGGVSSVLPLVGLFSASHMDFEIDRNATQQPSLPEMVSFTLKALKLLGEPFILLIEGSRIDMAAHVNDIAAQLHDADMYEQSFKLAIDFVQNRKDIMVVSVSDHETGGLVLARKYDDPFRYPPYEWFPFYIRQPKNSVEKMTSWVMNGLMSAEDAVAFSYGFLLSSDEKVALSSRESLAKMRNSASVLMYAFGDLLANRSFISWASYGHSGVDINVYTVNDPGIIVTGGSNSSDTNRRYLRGAVDNTMVGSYISQVLQLDLNSSATLLNLKNFDTSDGGNVKMPKSRRRNVYDDTAEEIIEENYYHG